MCSPEKCRVKLIKQFLNGSALRLALKLSRDYSDYAFIDFSDLSTLVAVVEPSVSFEP